MIGYMMKMHMGKGKGKGGPSSMSKGSMSYKGKGKGDSTSYKGKGKGDSMSYKGKGKGDSMSYKGKGKGDSMSYKGKGKGESYYKGKGAPAPAPKVSKPKFQCISLPFNVSNLFYSTNSLLLPLSPPTRLLTSPLLTPPFPKNRLKSRHPSLAPSRLLPRVRAIRTKEKDIRTKERGLPLA